jgi:hypothetical protein
MATSTFVETLENLHSSTRPNPDSRYKTMNTGRKCLFEITEYSLAKVQKRAKR